MSWLNVPHLRQADSAWCLPACVAMLAAYWQKPISQEEIARWLETTSIGTPASRVQRLAEHGFDTVYRTSSLAELHSWLSREIPVILFVRTGDLPYWEVDTPHSVVLAGLEGEESAHLFDPAIETGPATVPIIHLLLAWSHFDYACAVLLPANL